MTIDYVVPMVFPNDLKWQHSYLTATGSFRNDRSTLSCPRFRSWGTEELLIRCIRKNLPWLRTIYIILACPSQLQPWMKPLLSASSVSSGGAAQTPSVRIVFHKDIMPPEVLPTFNSRAIEMYLHRIPDLAPYFLYGNDDMFPLSPLPIEDFFRPAATVLSLTPDPSPKGKGGGRVFPPSIQGGAGGRLLPCLHYTRHPFNPERSFQVACMNGLNFVASHFGQHFDSYWLRLGHNIVPMVKSTCQLFWQQWPKQMQASVSAFRLSHNFNQYIYSWHHILSGQYIPHRAQRTYISVDAPSSDIIQAIRTANGLLCINDSNSVNDITNLAATIRSEIQKRL